MSDFGNIIDTITQDYLVPKISDNILGGNVLALRFLSGQKAAKAWGSISGTSVLVPIKYAVSTSGGWYSGYDSFTTAQSPNTRVNATFKPKQMYWTVAASGIQVAVNKGPQATLDLLTVEMDSVAADMADTFGTGFYSDGTGTTNKQLTGLDALVDDGTTTTYAGLLRSTYTTWVSTLSDSTSAAITRAMLATAYEAATIGSDQPTLGVTTPAVWATIEGLAMGTISFNNPMPGLGREYGTVGRAGVTRGQGGELGYTSLFFRGRPIVADEKCTSARFYWLNENHIGLATWPYPDFPGYVTKPNYNGFCWTGLKFPTNQDAGVGQFLWYGELVTDSCRTSSYMTNKT